jgi:hypothetical protein
LFGYLKKSIYKNISNYRNKKELVNLSEESIPLNLTFTYKKEKFVRFENTKEELKFFFFILKIS